MESMQMSDGADQRRQVQRTDRKDTFQGKIIILSSFLVL